MLTTAQLQTLKAAIFAETDPVFVAKRNAFETEAMADWFNAPSAKIVWRTSVTQDEIQLNGFDWVQVDNLTVGKARIWEWLFRNAETAINPSKSNIRAGIDEAWKGTAAMLAVRAAIYVHCKRAASRLEALFATGTGTDADPALLGYEGTVRGSEIVLAFNS